MGKARIHTDIEETIRLVRQLFHLLKAVGAELHAESGITVPMRGVLETLHREGPSAVPRMARQRPVSRQHIQRLVDQLLEQGLVRLATNPDHRRSQLVELTDAGRRAFGAMAERERAPIALLGQGLSDRDLATTRAVLEQLRARLVGMLTEGQTTRRNKK